MYDKVIIQTSRYMLEKYYSIMFQIIKITMLEGKIDRPHVNIFGRILLRTKCGNYLQITNIKQLWDQRWRM